MIWCSPLMLLTAIKYNMGPAKNRGNSKMLTIGLLDQKREREQIAIKAKTGRFKGVRVILNSSWAVILRNQNIRPIITKILKASSFGGLNIRTR
ncbi:hypothetical protein ES703_100167 [subsurface metagenome]